MRQPASRPRILPLALLPLAAVLVTILVQRPFLGTSDDWLFIQVIEDAQRDGLWHTLKHFVASDITSWGMVRPYYPFYSIAIYWIGLKAPLFVYLFNWLVVSATVVALSLALSLVFFAEAQAATAFASAFCAAYFAFPWASDLYVITAMQEKWVLLLGALNLWWFVRQDRTRPAASFYAGSAAALIGGFLTKAQFAIFIPALLLILALRMRAGGLQARRLLFVGALSTACVIALKIIGAHGQYTAHFSIHNIVPNLRVPQFAAILAAALVWSAGCGMLRKPILWQLPSLFIFSFLAIFLQWGYAGYLMAAISFAVASMAGLAISRLGGKALTACLTALCLASSVVATHRVSQLLGAYASIGKFLESAEIRELSKSRKPIWMSCGEGAVAFRMYARKFAGLYLEVVENRTLTPELAPAYALGDRKMCPLPPPLDEAPPIWTSDKPNSFKLVKYVTPGTTKR